MTKFAEKTELQNGSFFYWNLDNQLFSANVTLCRPILFIFLELYFCSLTKKKVLIWVVSPSPHSLSRGRPCLSKAQQFKGSPLGTPFSNLVNVCAHYPSIISCTVLDMLFHLSR